MKKQIIKQIKTIGITQKKFGFKIKSNISAGVGCDTITPTTTTTTTPDTTTCACDSTV